MQSSRRGGSSGSSEFLEGKTKEMKNCLSQEPTASSQQPGCTLPGMTKQTGDDLHGAADLEALINDHGLLTGPRPTVDREQLQFHLREVLRLLHVDLEDENVVDTPRRWSESLVTLTSG